MAIGTAEALNGVRVGNDGDNLSRPGVKVHPPYRHEHQDPDWGKKKEKVHADNIVSHPTKMPADQPCHSHDVWFLGAVQNIGILVFRKDLIL